MALTQEIKNGIAYAGQIGFFKTSNMGPNETRLAADFIKLNFKN